ncbi:MAG TPA: hypothetical protein PK993_01315 [Clostridia bacterium]|nr:hypothetical protein [Clostridia bacterium]
MKKKLKIIIPVVLVVIIAIITSLYFFTDLFKSPKTLFFKYMGKTFQSEKGYTYDKFLEELDYYFAKASTTNTELTVDANIEGVDQKTLEEIKNVKLSMVSKVGPKQEQSYSKMELSYKNDSLTSIEYLNSDNNYGIRCSDIYKDYFYVENSGLKNLVKKLGADPTTVPDSISKINIYDLFYISKDTRKSILNRYYKVLNSELDKDNFSSEKNVKIDVNGKDVKADSYTLSLSEDDMKSIILETMNTLKDDDETLDLLVEKYKMSIGNTETTEISKDDIKKGIDSSIKSLEKSEETGLGKVKITVYETNGKVVKLTIDSAGASIGLDITENKKDGIMNLYVESNGSVIGNIKNEYTIDGDTTKGKISMRSVLKTSLVQTKNNSDVNTMEMEEVMNLDYTIIDSKTKQSIEAKMNLMENDKSNKNNIAILFKYEMTGENLDKNPTKYDFNGFIKIVEDTTKSDSQYVTVNFKGNTEYTDTIDIPKLNKSNGVCINTVTDTELETIKTDINTNLNTFMDKILKKFNMSRSDAGMPEGTINFTEQMEGMSSLLSNKLDSPVETNYLPNTEYPGTTYDIDNVDYTKLQNQIDSVDYTKLQTQLDSVDSTKLQTQLDSVDYTKLQKQIDSIDTSKFSF